MDASAKSKKAPARAAATASQEAKQKPVETLRVDDCSASIWARESMAQGKPRTYYSLTLERSYKDRDGAWKYTKSFDPDSLGKIATLCEQASQAIRGLQEQEAVK